MTTINDYILEKEIGRGSFGVVYKAHNRHKNIFAIKCIYRKKINKTISDNIISEITLLKNTLKHVNIVHLYDFDWDSKFCYIIMEFCAGGDLFQYISAKIRLMESISRRIFQQIVSAVIYLHGIRVVHMDLKPQNILLVAKNNLDIKIADFGLAMALKQPSISQPCGTPIYMAPELVRGAKYDTCSDLWSIGIILYQCVFGVTPFDKLSKTEILVKLGRISRIVVPRGLSDDCREVLLALLVADPEKRMSHGDLAGCAFVTLGSPFNQKGIEDEIQCVKTRDELNSQIKKNIRQIIGVNPTKTGDIQLNPTKQAQQHPICADIVNLEAIMTHLDKAAEMERNQLWTEALQVYKYWLSKLDDLMRGEVDEMCRGNIKKLFAYYLKCAEKCVENISVGQKPSARKALWLMFESLGNRIKKL